ncbi:MAG: MurT ligase domain-containing protein [Clostridia bacterium]
MVKIGGNLPGKLAMKWDSKIFRYFKLEGKIIAVTGTNGKTMTNNLIGQILRDNGNTVITNAEGNNMETGILSVLIKNCTLSGRVKADYLVFETDESYVPILYKMIPLDCLVVLNFFRDQLDRSGEVESLILKIQNFVENYTGNLILNSDDPNVSRLGKANKRNKNIFYFKVEKYKYATKELKEAGEGKFCPFCNTRLIYDYYQYAHIGKFKCPKCYYGNNQLFHILTDVDLENKTFKIDEKEYKTQFNNIYAIYNIAAATAVAKRYNIPTESVMKTVANFVLNNGRLEKMLINNCETTINLAKNPTGANVSLRLLEEDPENKELLFVLNDNIADGKDVSWIWDINFEDLEKVDRVITAGTRPYDVAIRLKTSNYPVERIFPCETLEEAVEELYKTQGKKYVIANYTSVQPTRRELIKYKEKSDEKNERN